jgi:hypothetical protein
MLVAAPAARAAFSAVPSPGTQAPIVGFAASKGAWIIGQAGVQGASLSRNHGQSWSAVTLPTGPSNTNASFAGISVGGDGAFYMAAAYPYASPSGTFGALLRVNPDDGVVTTVSTLPIMQANPRVSAPAFDAQGRAWIAWTPRDSSVLTLARIAGGAAVETYTGTTTPRWESNAEIQFRASGTWVSMGGEVFRVSGGTLVPRAQGMPSLEEGSLVITDRVSVDGGQSFYNTTRGAFAVEGDPTLLGDDSGIMRRYSPAMFAATAARWPLQAGGAPINRVIAMDGGFVALHDGWRQPLVTQSSFSLLWHPGPVADLPFATGPLSPLFTSWLTEANGFRAQAGLPPLVGDPAITAASENHSRYWAMNVPAAGMDVHSEYAGTPGYTGQSPSQRCAATGAFCVSEVSTSLTDAVGWWTSSVYHRFLTMAPTALYVGGGRAPGGPAIMNGGQTGGLLVGPVVFPRGTYNGPSTFSYEFPECESKPQVTDPLGPAVSVWVPGGTLSGFTLSPAGGQPLAACTMPGGSVLLPEDPLIPDTYTASVNWQPSAYTPSQTITWQFTSTSDPAAGGPSFFVFPAKAVTNPVTPPAAPSRCSASLKRVAAAVRKPASIAVRVRACGKATVTVGIYRLHPATARQRRAVTHKSFTMRVAATRTLRLTTRRLRTGRFALRATLKAAKPKKLNSSITILAPRRALARRR